jgi:hypothetical protein
LRLSTLVYVLPLHNPMRLIEEICLIDQLSHGRFEVGVGRGTGRAQEWRMWGGDASENDARFEETLEILLQGLQCDFLSHRGQFYNFKDLWMELRPHQQPLPPFWYAGNAAHAGERGMNFVSDITSGFLGTILPAQTICSLSPNWRDNGGAQRLATPSTDGSAPGAAAANPCRSRCRSACEP